MITFGEVRENKVPQNGPKTQQIAMLTLSHSETPEKLSQIKFCFKLCYTSKIYALEIVYRGSRKSSFQALLTPPAINPFMHNVVKWPNIL